MNTNPLPNRHMPQLPPPEKPHGDPFGAWSGPSRALSDPTRISNRACRRRPQRIGIRPGATRTSIGWNGIFASYRIRALRDAATRLSSILAEAKIMSWPIRDQIVYKYLWPGQSPKSLTTPGGVDRKRSQSRPAVFPAWVALARFCLRAARGGWTVGASGTGGLPGLFAPGVELPASSTRRRTAGPPELHFLASVPSAHVRVGEAREAP